MDVVVFGVLLFLGFVIGQIAERRHYESIQQREEEFSDILTFATKHLPPSMTPCETTLVTGSVVVSVDFFKRFVAGLRNLIGGRVTVYETLVDRARREALLRMKEQVRAVNGGCVFNIKLETSSIYKGRGSSVGSVEVLAYGTAIISST